MQGTLFLVFLVLGALLMIGLGLSTIFLVPLVVVGLAILLAAPILGWLRASGTRGTSSSEPSGVPTTREASYDPVQEP